jgi:hypothetical protein
MGDYPTSLESLPSSWFATAACGLSLALLWDIDCDIARARLERLGLSTSGLMNRLFPGVSCMPMSIPSVAKPKWKI